MTSLSKRREFFFVVFDMVLFDGYFYISSFSVVYRFQEIMGAGITGETVPIASPPMYLFAQPTFGKFDDLNIALSGLVVLAQIMGMGTVRDHGYMGTGTRQWVRVQYGTKPWVRVWVWVRDYGYG